MIREQNIQTLSSDIAAIGKKFPGIDRFEQEVAKMQLKKLSNEEYYQAHKAFFSRTNQHAMMIEAGLRYADEVVGSKAECSVLSVGCGYGLFDEPFLRQLSLKTKKLHFVGVDRNEAECVIIEKKCHAIAPECSPKHKFAWQIYPMDFGNFESCQRFNIILLVHVCYYFPNLEYKIRKAYELLDERGKLIIMNNPLEEFKAPSSCIMKQLGEIDYWYSEDIQLVLNQCQLSFKQERIGASLNITECFNPDSDLGKKVLNFIVSVKVEYFSSLQLQLLLEYLRKISSKKPDGEIIVSYPVDVFCIKKGG
ncbi:MAG: methyltransferase domain-containing protein [Hormoscilla sp. GUM202]|nr:methyltransferase domain-containing protein [Hormoscilla sp. GUM202]